MSSTNNCKDEQKGGKGCNNAQNTAKDSKNSYQNSTKDSKDSGSNCSNSENCTDSCNE